MDQIRFTTWAGMEASSMFAGALQTESGHGGPPLQYSPSG